MRLALFTNEFPTQVNTYFARDLKLLITAGFEVDIYPLRPLNSQYWSSLPSFLADCDFSRESVHHVTLGNLLRRQYWLDRQIWSTWFKVTTEIVRSAVDFGPKPVAKTLYSALKGLALFGLNPRTYDHVLAYWGNYAATYAFIYHLLNGGVTPFSFFLHAGVDLYRDQVYLKQKSLHAQNIFVVCEFNRQFLKSLFPDVYSQLHEKVHTYHLGLDLSQYTFQPELRKQKKIIAVGRLDKKKGFDYLLCALSQLYKEGTTAELEIIGDGPEFRRLENLAKELGIMNQLTFRGWLSIEEVKTAMLSSTVLVHPSPTIGDAVPTVIKEAMALGTPVISTTIAGIPELLDGGRCGVLVPPRDVHSLATAIASLLGDRALRKSLADAGRDHAEKTFDINKNGRELVRILSRNYS